MSSGYSGTPLARKLGIKDGSRIFIENQPDHYFSLFSDLPPNIHVVNDPKQKKDIIHFFVTEEAKLSKNIASLKNQIEQDGAIWISWPKKASKVPTDITEDVVRSIALKNGLVDIKVCAVDEVWSGLKLVIPVRSRKV